MRLECNYCIFKFTFIKIQLTDNCNAIYLTINVLNVNQ